MNRSYRTIALPMIMVVISALTSAFNAYSCMTTIINDSSDTILVVDHNDASNKDNVDGPGSIFSVTKNSSRRFGKAHEHSHFTVYTKQRKSPAFVATYKAQQNECGKNGNPAIKMSDLKEGTGDTALFTVHTLHTPYSSMVRDLPSLQRPDIFKEEPAAPKMSDCFACTAAAAARGQGQE